MAHDLRALIRLQEQRSAAPTAMILDSRTLQSTPTSGRRAGYDGTKRRKGAKVHAAVDTLGNLLALNVTPANERDRAQVEILAQAVQAVTDKNVTLAYVDQVYTSDCAADAAKSHGIKLEVSNSRKPKKDSSYSRAAGSSNAPPPGPLASAVSLATLNAPPPPWLPTTGSPSSPSPFQHSSAKVHDSL